MKATLYIAEYYHGRETIWAGNIDQLNEAFGYSLSCGHAYDKRINPNPRGAASLVKALNRSSWSRGRYNEHNEVSSRAAFLRNGGKRSEDGTGTATRKL